MEYYKNNCLKYFIYGITSTLTILILLYKFDFVFEQSFENNSNYIKKSEIKNFLNNQNKTIVEKNSFLLKKEIQRQLDLKDYEFNKEKEKNVKLIKQKKNLDKEIQKLKLLLSQKTTNNGKLRKKIQKIYYAYDFKNPILLFFSKDTSNIDIQSKKEIEKLKNLNFHKSIIFKINSCINNFENDSIILKNQRANSIKNTLRKFIDTRKIRIEHTCEDPFNENIFDEKDNRLVLGAAISFESNNYY